MRFFAHSLEHDPNPDHWQLLENHLKSVAGKASEFASVFNSAEWGCLAGILHDLGKFQIEFQNRLQGNRVSVDHSGIGAAQAAQLHKENGYPLAFVAAGHHAGLANLITGGSGLPTPLKERLKSSERCLSQILKDIPENIRPWSIPDLPDFLQNGNTELQDKRRSIEFWVRFLFSALVDADRLDTEAFCQPLQAKFRGGYESVHVLSDKADAFIQGKIESLAPEERETPVNRARALVLEACQKSSSQNLGIFSLTVPTGGGKTLSSMSFALHHARQFGVWPKYSSVRNLLETF